MTYRRDQVLCDCNPYCVHDGKPGEGIKCRSRDDWYVTLCSLDKCPGPFSIECCHKPSQEPEEE